MMALGMLNRLGSTALLAGGITPIVASSVASSLIGKFTGDEISWTRWFVLMALPFYSVLAVGGAVVYIKYRSGFQLEKVIDVDGTATGPLKLPEVKAAFIALGTALLWFTDFARGHLNSLVLTLLTPSYWFGPKVSTNSGFLKGRPLRETPVRETPVRKTNEGI